MANKSFSYRFIKTREPYYFDLVVRIKGHCMFNRYNKIKNGSEEEKTAFSVEGYN